MSSKYQASLRIDQVIHRQTSEGVQPFITVPVVFRSGIQIKHKGLTTTLLVASSWIKFDLELDAKANEGGEVKQSANVFVEVVSREGDGDEVTDFLVKGQLSLGLPWAMYECICKNLSLGVQLLLDGEADSGGYRKPFEIAVDDDYAVLSLTNVTVSTLVGKVASVDWYEPVFRYAVSQHYSNLYVSTYSSQVKRIVREMAESSAIAYGSLTALQAYRSDELEELLWHCQSTLKTDNPPSLKDADGFTEQEAKDVWSGSVAAFKKAIVKVKDSDRSEYARKHDTLWREFNVLEIAKRGEAKAGPNVFGFRAKADELEDLARKAIAMRPMYSDTLDRILIDALVFAETLAFAQSVFSKEKLFGVPLAGELKGTEKDVATVAGFARSFGKALLSFAFELVKVALTFGVAIVVTNENVVAAWIVTTGYTLFRWWVSTRSGGDKEKYMLLSKMANAHTFARQYDSNPRLVRNALYQAAHDGAVFSPLVFTLLDRLIEREGARTNAAAA